MTGGPAGKMLARMIRRDGGLGVLAVMLLSGPAPHPQAAFDRDGLSGFVEDHAEAGFGNRISLS